MTIIGDEEGCVSFAMNFALASLFKSSFKKIVFELVLYDVVFKKLNILRYKIAFFHIFINAFNYRYYFNTKNISIKKL